MDGQATDAKNPSSPGVVRLCARPQTFLMGKSTFNQREFHALRSSLERLDSLVIAARLGRKDLLRRLCLSDTTLRRRIAQRLLPQPRRDSAGRPYWLVSDLALDGLALDGQANGHGLSVQMSVVRAK